MVKPLVTVCRLCGLSKTKKLLEVRSLPSQRSRGVYVDDSGRQWHGSYCPQCTRLRESHKATYSDPDQVASLVVSRKAEWLVCRWLKEHWGYDVEPCKTCNGPDILLPNGEAVEVKRVVDGRVRKLGARRTADRWLALVFGEEHVVVVPLKDVFTGPAICKVVSRYDPRPRTRSRDRDKERHVLKLNQRNKCNRCDEVKAWLPPLPPGTVTSGRPQSGTRHVDERGRVWLGNRCPDCVSYINWRSRLAKAVA